MWRVVLCFWMLIGGCTDEKSSKKSSRTAGVFTPGDSMRGDAGAGDGNGDAGPGDVDPGDGGAGDADAFSPLTVPGDTTPPESWTFGDLSQGHALDNLAEAYCQSIQRCQPVTGWAHPDVDDCKRFFFEAPNVFWPELTNADLFTYDSASFETCLDDIVMRDCAEDPDFYHRASCQSAFVGKLELGQCCDDRGGCGAGLTCANRSNDATGLCATPAALGESCLTKACADDLFCGLEDTCEAAKAEGAACTTVPAGQCGGNLHCVGETCGAPPRLGSVCVFDTLYPEYEVECGRYAACSKTEEICVTKRPQGSSCSYFSSLSGGPCSNTLGLQCVTEEGVCGALGREGEDCFWNGTMRCEDPTTMSCSKSPGGPFPVCHDFLSEGQTCANLEAGAVYLTAGPCLLGLYCDETSSTCEPVARCAP